MSQTEQKPHDLLKPKEAAKRAGVSVQTLTKWANDGAVPCYRTPGGQRRYDPDELDKVLRQGGE